MATQSSGHGTIGNRPNLAPSDRPGLRLKCRSMNEQALVIGTHNRKKGIELAELLAPRGFAVVTLDDLPDAIEVVEDGDSFAANARLKASQQAVHLGRWVLADDSGLASMRWAVRRACTRPASPARTLPTKTTIAAAREAGQHAAGKAHGPLRLPCDGRRSDRARFGRRATTSAAAGSASSRPARTASATTRSSKSSSTTARLANSARM